MHDETHPYQPVAHETFVLRIWREASSGAWRGEIVRVADRASAPFASFDQAEAFVRRYLHVADASDPPPNWVHSPLGADAPPETATPHLNPRHAQRG